MKQTVCTHGILRLFSTLLLGLLIINSADGAKLRLSVKPGLKFDPIAFHVQPGEKVELLFDNVDEMMHNFVLVAPGSRHENSRIRHSPWSRWSEPTLYPGIRRRDRLNSSSAPREENHNHFRCSPENEGEYPYVCTFPGHGFIMIRHPLCCQRATG